MNPVQIIIRRKKLWKQTHKITKYEQQSQILVGNSEKQNQRDQKAGGGNVENPERRIVVEMKGNCKGL